MGQRVRAMMAAAAILAFGSGCTGGKFWKKSSTSEWQSPVGVPSAPLSSTLTPDAGGPVVQASAVAPANSAAFAAFGKDGKPDKKVAAKEITFLWRNKVDYLPHPTTGEMGAGLVGQMFLLGAKDQFAPVNGKLIVALYDETPRPPGVPANKPEGWEFTNETLKGYLIPDERFGLCYGLFLPWPTYRPDVTRIRVAARYEPVEGHVLHALETRITLDTTGPGMKDVGWTNLSQPQGQPAPGGFTALGGPPPAGAGNGPGFGTIPAGGMTNGAPSNGFTPQPGAMVPSAGPAMPSRTLQPAPAGYGTVSPGGPGAPGVPFDPSGLPPIAFTAPRLQGR